MERVRRVELPTLCLASMVGRKRPVDPKLPSLLTILRFNTFLFAFAG
jgi:hypothetical protein